MSIVSVMWNDVRRSVVQCEMLYYVDIMLYYVWVAWSGIIMFIIVSKLCYKWSKHS